MKDIEKFIEESVGNIRDDRAIASSMLVDIMQHIKVDDSKHQYFGPVAAKYLETLQRSNEQLVKLAALVQKGESKSTGITDQDKQDLFDLINSDEAAE